VEFCPGDYVLDSVGYGLGWVVGYENKPTDNSDLLYGEIVSDFKGRFNY